MFVSAFRSLNALFETKKIKCAFDKVEKATLIWKSTLKVDSSQILLQKPARFINITVGGAFHKYFCPNILLKTQFYPLINQSWQVKSTTKTLGVEKRKAIPVSRGVNSD